LSADEQRVGRMRRGRVDIGTLRALDREQWRKLGRDIAKYKKH